MVALRKGYSLAELIIIFIIIAILMTILLPVFYRARVKNQQNTCLDNQRRITMSMLYQAQERGGIMPLSQQVWQRVALPSETLQCPEVKDTVKNAYVYNNLVSGLPLADVSDASATPIIADGQHLSKTNGEYTNIAYSDSDLVARHDKATIVGYLDGHAALEANAHFWLKSLVEDFEQMPRVTMARDGIHQKDSSVSLCQNILFHGKRSLEISYHLTSVVNSFVTPALTGPKISIPIYRIGVMVKGDGSQQDIALRMIDAQGEIFEFAGNPSRCDNTEWHEVIFDLWRDTMHRAASHVPGAKSDGIMQYPIRFRSIMVKRTLPDSATKGRILIDNISVWANRQPKDILTP